MVAEDAGRGYLYQFAMHCADIVCTMALSTITFYIHSMFVLTLNLLWMSTVFCFCPRFPLCSCHQVPLLKENPKMTTAVLCYLWQKMVQNWLKCTTWWLHKALKKNIQNHSFIEKTLYIGIRVAFVHVAFSIFDDFFLILIFVNNF